jgi:hypothetical protein
MFIDDIHSSNPFYRPWDDVPEYDRQALDTMMDWTSIVNRILSNGSQKVSQE